MGFEWSSIIDLAVAGVLVALGSTAWGQHLHIVDLEDYRDTHYAGHLDCDSEISAQMVSMQTSRLYCDMCKLVDYGDD